MATARDLIIALRTRVPIEPINPRDSIQETENRIRILARIRSDGTSVAIDNWMNIILSFETRMEHPGCPWSADISKKYFKRGSKVVYAWRLAFQAEGISAHIPSIIEAISSAPLTSRAEVTEVPLLGASPNRNDTTGGKRGAGAVGTVPTGPLAVMRGR